MDRIVEIPPTDVVGIKTGGQDDYRDYNEKTFGNVFATWRKKWSKKEEK